MRPPKKSGLTAADVMSRQLVTVPLTATLEALAVILHENHISGAPVVDPAGHLAGVVSQSDLVCHETRSVVRQRIVPLSEETCVSDDDEEPESRRSAYYTHIDGEDLAELRAGFIEEDYGDATVADIYTPFTITASVDTTLPHLAALMVEKSVHRVIIVDGRRIAGIVTSMDLLRTIAPAMPASAAHCLTTQ